MIGRRRIRRARGGALLIRIPVDERAVLRSLPAQLRELVGSRDPSTRRLFPPAYGDDPELEAQYQDMVGTELLHHHLGSLELMERTIDQDRLDEEEAFGWLGALNAARLVVGTRLDVSEDMEPVGADHPDAQMMSLYAYLTALQSQLVEALGEPG